MKRLNDLFRRIAAGFDAIGSARRAASAVRSGRKPFRSDLVRLGINPHAFTSMGHG
jgi:hypothetical protein